MASIYGGSMRQIASIALFAVSSICFAEPTTMQIPDQGWQIKFDAPSVTKVKDSNNPTQYYFLGSAARFSLSLTVESPTCPGEMSAEDNYKCILQRIERSPMVVRQSISAEKRLKNVQVSYLIYAPVGGQAVKTMHTHVLFAHKSKWGDLHASFVRPTMEEVALLLRLG